MIERGFDETTGIIRVTASGDWDAAEIDDHYVQLRVLIDAVRARGLPVRVLVDVRAASPRSPLVEAQIADKKHATYQPEDRVAILTSNAEDKEHIRTLVAGTEKWSWQNELAAEQWLLLGDSTGKTP